MEFKLNRLIIRANGNLTDYTILFFWGGEGLGNSRVGQFGLKNKVLAESRVESHTITLEGNRTRS
jgi:hypothetical protein